jgi:signal transduction histidine kinase
MPMRPSDPTQTSNPEPPIQVTSAALAALRTPLAVIAGRAQLLRRRIWRGQPLSPDDYLTTLASIEGSVQELERQLRALEDAAYERRRRA